MSRPPVLDDYTRVAAAIRFLAAAHETPPSLADLAAHLGLSAFHVQRLFQRWAGISPKRFLQVLALARARPLLAQAGPVLETAHAVGLSGPGRLHDLCVALEAVTPGEYRLGGAGMTIRYGHYPSPFGEATLALTGRGVCGLAFGTPEERAVIVAELRGHWPRADWQHDDQGISTTARRIFQPVSTRGPLAVIVRGTNFQVRVWEALLRVPEATTTSYSWIAGAAERPAAVRAAASAVGDNPVAWLIPCHRVLRQSGALGGYRWGLERKQCMLAWETLRSGPPKAPGAGAGGTRTDHQRP